MDQNKVCTDPDVLPKLNDLDLCEEHKERLQALLHKHQHVFATHEEDYSRTTTVQHVIPTAEAPTILERYRQILPQMYQEVKSLIQGMLDSEIVIPSTSPWAAPIVLVQKKRWAFKILCGLPEHEHGYPERCLPNSSYRGVISQPGERRVFYHL